MNLEIEKAGKQVEPLMLCGSVEVGGAKMVRKRS